MSLCFKYPSINLIAATILIFSLENFVFVLIPLRSFDETNLKSQSPLIALKRLIIFNISF